MLRLCGYFSYVLFLSVDLTTEISYPSFGGGVGGVLSLYVLWEGITLEFINDRLFPQLSNFILCSNPCSGHYIITSVEILSSNLQGNVQFIS
jgi:hypothetical protein